MKRLTPLTIILSAVLGMSAMYLAGCGGDDDNEAEADAGALPEGTTTATADTTVASLQSKAWSLVSYGTPGSETGVLGGTSITATFSAGTVSGTSGCNSYSAGYNADDTGNLSVGSITTTLMMCNPPERMTQESAYRNALKNATAFQLEGGTLEIMYGPGQHLLFE